MFTDAIELAVAVVGLGLVVLAVKRARTKGWAASLQMAAGGFLLLGSAAVGIVEFVVGLAFSPLAWLGVGSLAMAAALFAGGQRLEGRPGKQDAIAEQGGAPKGRVGQSPSSSKSTSKRKGAGASGDPELDDIEAILRRHGIE